MSTLASAALSQKERLSSLGRLSTVIAHEVRNPLMIIKGSLHALRQPGLSAPGMREAVADIDEEVERLNRIAGQLEFIETDPSPSRAEVLDRLSQGEISADEAIRVLEEMK